MNKVGTRWVASGRHAGRPYPELAAIDFARPEAKLIPALMKFLLTLIVGIAIGAALVWYYRGGDDRGRLQSAGEQIGKAATSAREAIQEELRSLNLNGSAISNELARTGRVIRQKAQDAGRAISDATADARTTAAIKAKLVRDPDLSAWDISVNTTDGVVTLSGTAASAESIGKAIWLAIQTEGVRQVISTIQLKP
jgi:hyperosmotically inducible periplasmic protein